MSVAQKYKQGESRKTKSECTKVRHGSNKGVVQGGYTEDKSYPTERLSAEYEGRIKTERERLTNYVQIIRNFAFVENSVQREEEHTEVSHA